MGKILLVFEDIIGDLSVDELDKILGGGWRKVRIFW
jgi:hypothetical protein